MAIDRLKIDRSFVGNIASNPGELAIARTIIAIGRQLGLEIVAEGVETAEQAALLTDSGCHILQGWLFGRSATADDIERRLFAAVQPALGAGGAVRVGAGETTGRLF